MNNQRPPCPLEHDEQAALIQWAEIASRSNHALALLFAIPNGGERHKAVAAKLKAEGVKPGVPDLCLPVPSGDYHGLFIEMKRIRGSSTTLWQLEWIDALRQQGYRVEVCKGWEAAKDVLLEYLNE